MIQLEPRTYWMKQQEFQYEYQYSAGDKVVVKVAGTLTSTATILRDPYVSNMGIKCVYVDVDNEIGERYIYLNEVIGYAK